MVNDLTIGWAVLGIPLLIAGLVLIQARAILFFFVVALAVGLGYLTSSGAVQDIGKETLRIVDEQMGATGGSAATPEAPAAPVRPDNPVSNAP